MRSRLWLLAVSLLSLPSLAADRKFLEPLGWTADGAFFAYRLGFESIDGNTGQGGKGVNLVVLNARTGELKKYPQKSDEGEAWLKAHPVTAVAASRTSPDGKSQVKVELKSDDGKSKWSGASYAFGCVNPDDCMMTQGTMTMTVEKGGKTYKGWKWEEASAGNLHGTVSAFWSPDGRRIAWGLERGYAMLNDFGYARVGISAVGPKLEVLAPAGLAADRIESALGALEKAGFAPTQVGVAQKAREKAAVYFAPGFEQDGAAAAAALGATAEKLSWKADADLVIALPK